MKYALITSEIVLWIVALIALIQVRSYIKKHADELLEDHETYIFPRFICITVCTIAAGIMNLILVIAF